MCLQGLSIPDVPCEHELGLILHVHVYIPEGGYTIDLYILGKSWKCVNEPW